MCRFTALGYGAALQQPIFTRPGAWRVLDVIIVTVRVTLAISLVVPVLRGT